MEIRTCPKCGQEYTGEPAVSRRDESDICPRCGRKEAIEDFVQWRKDGSPVEE